MNRAYSLLTIKSVDDSAADYYTIRGIATTPTADRMDDVVEPTGAKFKLPIPLLWQHDSKKPIGEVVGATVTDEGITFEARVPKVKEPGTLKDRIDEAIQSVQYNIVKGTSIGFKEVADKVKFLKTGGLHFLEWLWLELSLVTIPANAEATIITIKTLDTEQRAALGRNADTDSRIKISSPGATGKQKETSKEKKVNIQENISGFEAKRAATFAAKEEIINKSIEDGEVPSQEDSEKVKTYESEIDRIDDHLKTLRNHEKQMLVKAKPILPAEGMDDAQERQKVPVGTGVIRANANLPKGIGLARYAKALCWARLNMTSPVEYAKQWDDSTPEVGLQLKTAISAGTTTDSTWAGPLVYANNLASEFVDYLRPQTILGKLTGLRRVPFNIRYPIQNGGSTVAWVGQGAPKPVSKLSFTSATLGFSKAAGIVVITQELVRFSSPSAELVIRDDMAAQMVYFLDQQFIDPGVAAVANVSPASILNGAANVRTAAASWTSMANVLTDVYAFMTTFAANEISLDGSYWVMTPDTALRLSLLLNTGGTALAFPDITINGGTFLGIPVIISNSLPHSVSAGAIIALIKPSEVFLADDGGVNITVSGEASLNMDSAPTNNSATPTATSVVSMFQTDSIAIRAERFINWSLRRTYGVGYIDNMHTT